MIKRFANSIARAFVDFSKYSLKTGIKAAEITPPIITSKNKSGIFVAAKYASAALPVPKNAPINESRSKPHSFAAKVATIINPAV